MNDVPIDLYIAGYSDPDAAKERNRRVQASGSLYGWLTIW